ncbi:hypothetical protein C8R44DRAFT_725876 [Mycena epipterygia]|nr:hypothetical protein C8R44DRAFT_725876 [Mycena epipterygia]
MASKWKPFDSVLGYEWIEEVFFFLFLILKLMDENKESDWSAACAELGIQAEHPFDSGLGPAIILEVFSSLLVPNSAIKCGTRGIGCRFWGIPDGAECIHSMDRRWNASGNPYDSGLGDMTVGVKPFFLFLVLKRKEDLMALMVQRRRGEPNSARRICILYTEFLKLQAELYRRFGIGS